jgi:hypothetical protein
VTHPSATTVGPAYGGSTMFVAFSDAQKRALRGGGSTAKIKTFVPEGYTLDHVANGGMYLRRKVDSRTQFPTAGPTVAESNTIVAANQKKQADDLAKVNKAFQTRHAWVDGQYVTLVEDKNGNLTAAPVGGGASTTLARPTAFSALDASQIDESTPFLMSHYQFGTPQTPGAVTGKPSTGGMFSNLLHSLSTGGQGMMTIGSGVAWLANLSTKDQGAYQAMLDKLHSAGYLNDSDYAEANGHWSTAAGNAFLLAARDVAVVNTTEGGQNTTLDEFLGSKAGAAGRAKANAYTPVERSYTDPTAIKAAARSAAEDLLGRQLTPDEEARLTGHFRGLEDTAFDQVDAAGRQGQGAAYTPPNASGQIDAFINDDAHSQEAANWRVAQYGQALKDLFSQRTQLT